MSRISSTREQFLRITLWVDWLASLIWKLVDDAYNLHRAQSGSTISLRDGNVAGRKLYAVSIYPERSAGYTTSPSRQNIIDFVLLNLHLLMKPGHAFGSWFDRSQNVHVLDVVLCLPDRRAAIELGRFFSETAIYDLSAKRQIAINAPRGQDVQIHGRSTIRPNLSKRLSRGVLPQSKKKR